MKVGIQKKKSVEMLALNEILQKHTNLRSVQYLKNFCLGSLNKVLLILHPQMQLILQQNTKKCLKLNSCFLSKNLQKRKPNHSNSKISHKIQKNKFLTETITTRHQLSQKDRHNHYHKLHKKHLLCLRPIPVSILHWLKTNNSNSKTQSSKNNQDTTRTSSTTPKIKTNKVDHTSTVKE